MTVTVYLKDSENRLCTLYDIISVLCKDGIFVLTHVDGFEYTTFTQGDHVLRIR